MSVQSSGAWPRTRRAALCAFGLGLVACGRYSLGSRQEVDAGQGGADAGQGDAGAGSGGSGGSGSSLGGGGGSTGGGASGSGGSGTLPDAGDGAVLDAGPLDAGDGGDSADAAPPVLIDAPSCRRAQPRCGLDDASCCDSPLVPAGTFSLTANLEGPVVVAATVPSFHLDRFEVSVGRAREFLADYDAWRARAEPQAGAGSHPRIADSGWQESFTAELPASALDLDQGWGNCLLSTNVVGVDPRVPMNCLTWYEAFAFCIWDGGRLPTLAELAYAAAGGSENRIYPWGDTPVPNPQRASFGCGEFGTVRPECSNPLTTLVGALPLGAGRFGQLDLAGSVGEWVLDGLPRLAEACTDCVSLIDVSSRSWRGGSWAENPEMLENSWFNTQPPFVPTPFTGVRCARDE